MIRSIQNRIILLIAIIGGCMVLGIFIGKGQEKKRIRLLLNKEMTERAVLLDKVCDFKSKSLQNFTYDYTYWDEMVNFTKTLSPEWAYGNIEISLPTFNIDYAWVYNNELSVVYHTHSDTITAMKFIPIQLSELKGLVARGALYDFFVRTPSAVIQISGGSIHPTNDPERKTPPNGYLFVGRIWTPKYLSELEELTGTQLFILDQQKVSLPPDSIRMNEFKFFNFKPLRGWNGDVEAVISSTGEVEIAKDFQRDSKTNIFILAVSLIISLAFVSLILIYIINRPLKSLIISLMKDDPEPIRDLVRQKSEFGQIAQLMSDFFDQKKKLMDEIEERIKVEKELIIAKDKAEESDRLKTAFLNNISHEIRTPMNAIVGFSELIHDSRISETERNEFTTIIRDSSYRLLGIITDLINLSTVESGQEILAEEKFNLNSFLQGVYNQIKPTMNSSKVVLVLDMALKDEHSLIIADKTKLSQIMVNLLKNSVKFTSTGKIKFGYTIRKGEIEFFIIDTGIGIPENKFETIFARFQQVDDSSSRQFGGAGLGLPISKAYAELLGGHIWLKSDVGIGSQFFFTIPFKTI